LRRCNKAIEEGEAAKAAALGLAPEVAPEPSRAHMAAQSEDHMRARFGGFLPRCAISQSVNDGASNAAGGEHGQGQGGDDDGDGAAHLAEVHERVFRGMTVRTVMDSQFPTCRGDERCAETCVLAARSATDACMAWLHAPPASAAAAAAAAAGDRPENAADSTAACADALNAARTNCGAEESARCVEPLAAGFHALGVPGGATTDPDPNASTSASATTSATSADVTVVTDADAAEDDAVEKHSRSVSRCRLNRRNPC